MAEDACYGIRFKSLSQNWVLEASVVSKPFMG